MAAVATLVYLTGFAGLCLAGWHAIGSAFAADPDEARFLKRVFAVAVAARLAVALGTYVFLPYGLLAPDEACYLLEATNIVSTKHIDLVEFLNGHAWQYFNAATLLMPGAVNALLPRLWNCFVGSLCVVPAYVIARQLGAGAASRFAAVLTAAFPSIVLWSSLNIKDADVWFLILVAAALILRIQQQPGARYAYALGATLAVLITLRWVAAAGLVVALGVALLSRSEAVRSALHRPRFWQVAGGATGFVVLVVVAAIKTHPAAVARIYGAAHLTGLAYVRREFTVGAHSTTIRDPGLDTLGGTLAFLPQGFRDFLLRPYPWEGAGSLAALTRPETIAYYLLLVLALYGIFVSLRTRPEPAIPLITFLLGMGLGYGLILANLGTIYRERAQLILVMFCFAAVAVGSIRARLPTRGRAGERGTVSTVNKHGPTSV